MNTGSSGGSCYEQALSKAMKLLTARARSEKQIYDRLTRAGFDDASTSRVVARLVEVGLLDDHAFAVRSASQAVERGLSHRAIHWDLKSKGISGPAADSALRELLPNSDGSERALNLALKRLRSYEGLPASTVQRRLGGYLARKGYDSEIVREVCEKVVPESEPA